MLADAHGGVISLGARECSLQRRHQKVIEEAPALAAPEGIERDAVALARACGYVGAGTVEFVVSEGAHHFLEMNTRLQVEHAVTEEIFGIDLVEWQLRIAAGEALAEPPAPRGHAIEARVYAEDPAHGFLPSAGRLLVLELPESVRVDCGVAEGETIGTRYDPMIAKLTASGATREQARLRLLAALRASDDPRRPHERRAPVRAARGRARARRRPRHRAGRGPRRARATATARGARRSSRRSRPGRRTRTPSPALARGACSARRPVRRRCCSAWRRCAGRSGCWSTSTAWRSPGCSPAGGSATTARAGRPWQLRRSAELPGEERELRAPMPGAVVSVPAPEGDEVARGDVVVVLESMKMELQITAPADGVLDALHVAAGDQVALGDRARPRGAAMTRVLASAAQRSSPQFAANVAAHEALVAELRERLARAAAGGRRGGPAPPARARQAAGARAHRAAVRPRDRVPRALAARRRRALRRRAARSRDRHRRRARARAPRRRRRQRRDGEGRQLRADDRQEAPARTGDRARQPPALHLPRRLGRRVPAAPGRGLPRPRPLRADLLQPGAALAGRDRADRGGHGLLHRRRRLRPGDERRDRDRRGPGDDLPRRPAAREGRDRRGRRRAGARRRRRAHAHLRRRRPPRARRRARARAGARHRRHAARAGPRAVGDARPASRRRSIQASSSASSHRTCAPLTTCAR